MSFLKSSPLLGVLGTNEIIIMFVGVLILIIPIYFIYKYGKNKGRLQEMERQIKDREQNN